VVSIWRERLPQAGLIHGRIRVLQCRALCDEYERERWLLQPFRPCTLCMAGLK
jgi:hypothetical protein